MTKLQQRPSPISAGTRAFAIRSLTLALTLSATATYAGSFTVASGTDTTAKTLGSGSGQTGNVAADATLSVGGSTVAVTISGNNAALTNNGSILQTGTGRVIRDNTGVTGLMITNGSATNSSALMQAADADVIQMNKSPASVTLTNYGTMTSLNASGGGSQVVDFNAIASGSNIVYNYGTMQAQDADVVRPGVNGVVHNYGTIKSTIPQGDTGTDGIDAQKNTGVVINNYETGSIVGARHGITGGAADNTVYFTTTVNNAGSIAGNNGSGINLDGFNARQTATIINSGTIVGKGVTGDGDGIDVDGVVNITNSGIIRSLNSYSATTPAQSEGITVGGGTITNSGTIEGLVAAGNANAVGRGITIAGVDSSGTPEPIYANSTVTNLTGGLIRGQSDSAIAVEGGKSGFTVTINNNAGASIVGGGTANAAIRGNADNTTITNGGRIDGSSSGKAIQMGAGNNVLNITGGQAVVLGSIDGGVGGRNKMTVDPGAGNGFSYGGSISNFASVEIKSGTVTFSGASDYTGETRLSGGTLVLDGGDRLSADSALVLDGGNLALVNGGQTFASLSLLGDSSVDVGDSLLTFNGLGDVLAGKGLTFSDDSADLTFRFLGDVTHDARFLALMAETRIDGRGTSFRFDGTYTDVAAVPEPETYAMLMAGLGVLGLLRRRRA